MNSCVRRLQWLGSGWHTTTQNYWIVEIKHNLWGHQVQPNAQSKLKQSKLLRAEPRWILDAYSE